jgi:glycosyltransferase involved in cell wall biosynthesis
LRAPLLTIAIPTFKRLAYLREALRSSLEQTYSAYEVLISDDGASEELREFCEMQARAEARVRYIHTPKRLGLSGNWNGAPHTRGARIW